ncbi:hypothetical protein P67b_00013 [Ruegeria phage Tedan]|nr:hypothetical protein P67b_00013 [Ruegeria phage Tedan]
MAQITLNSKQVNELAAFLKKHNKTTFFLAKDDGAYVGATAGSQDEGNFERVIFYFRGMNPNKDEFAWDNARDAFGGDDFGEFLDGEFIFNMAEKIDPKVTIKVTATQIKMDGTFKKDAAKPAAPKKPATPKKPAAPKDVKKMTKGEQIRQLLAEGVDVETIVGMVGTTANSVRWHKSKMNKG